MSGVKHGGPWTEHVAEVVVWDGGEAAEVKCTCGHKAIMVEASDPQPEVFAAMAYGAARAHVATHDPAAYAPEVTG